MTRTAPPVSRVVVILGIVTAFGGTFVAPLIADEPSPIEQILARAQVWTRTNVAAMDIKTGPRGIGAFPFRATVTCDYVDEQLDGASPKFACKAGDDELKVKYGGANGEVYGEVLATRLLWALGFGADRMYPVNVICRGCPEELGGIERAGKVSRFDPAVVERKMPGKEYEVDDKAGWSWKDFARVAPARGAAPRAHRDALTLLAVFIQHSDSKPEQQRILCLGSGSNGKGAKDACARPFLIVQDLGLTFGRPTTANTNSASSVNLAAWRETPVWKPGEACIGNLPKSFSGTLDDPAISEEGRRFLANLLLALSDRQIRDLFEVARIELRLRKPSDTASGFASIDEWVDAFKAKRAEIVERRCATSSLTRNRS
jgi:hypothetical protein